MGNLVRLRNAPAPLGCGTVDAVHGSLVELLLQSRAATVSDGKPVTLSLSAYGPRPAPCLTLTRTPHHFPLPQEGEEPESFWAALGGRADYASSSSRRHVSGPALLLHLRDAAGRGLKVDVYTVFSQEHLVGDDVLLLDTGAEVRGAQGGRG